MTEFLRRLVIKFFLDEKIINERKALESIISLKGTKARKLSGFSIDNRVKLFGGDHKAGESLEQYISRLQASPARKQDQQKRAIATDNKFCYNSGTGDHVIIVCEGCRYQVNSDIAVGGKDYLSGELLPMEKVSTPYCATMGKLSKFLK